MPCNWIASLVWWITFFVAMLSVWPDAHRAFGQILEANGITINLLDTMVIIPVMMGLTKVQLVHGLAIKRRARLLST